MDHAEDSQPIPAPAVVPISSLIPAVAKSHRKLAGSLLQDLGLAAGQEFVLMLLWQVSPQSQADLTRQLMVEPPTSAKALARLENLGLVTRERSGSDRRVLLVSLTDAGRALEAPVMAVWATLEAVTTAGLDQAEQDQLRGLLARLDASLAAAPEHRAAGH
ncbi:MarR family transcriptional regulator [Curtobacterium sp. MCPF17_047]|uniref:MarR family winged helix-turn-helix transcriptional regulator n=1 Tax=Curtobacterium sp. MCPF17_047 TaxID=2175654 RepID=UPI000DA91B95|nr:MarR family transcriptional regulator [Curtobacterium sp. MCPF17_047]PZF61910.1 MarR family transcriptional regulator [Curtobacterium sp. MCPF17_047]